MQKARKLSAMIADMNYPDEIARAVEDHAISQGTVKRIESGELVLPHPQDAWTWHMRETGRAGMTPAQIADRSRVIALEQLVRELSDHVLNPSPERAEVLKQRIAELSTSD